MGATYERDTDRQMLNLGKRETRKQMKGWREKKESRERIWRVYSGLDVLSLQAGYRIAKGRL
jgi:hypothetical protein